MTTKKFPISILPKQNASEKRRSLFPNCEAHGLSTLADLEASKVEQALTLAFEQGKLAGIAEERDRVIRWLWNQDNAICTDFKAQFPRLKSQLKEAKK